MPPSRFVRSPELPALRLSRNDVRRFLIVAGILVAALTIIFAVDLVPRGSALEVGTLAPSDIRAPRTLEVVSRIQTDAARAAARAAVPPQYDYSTDAADETARQQLAALDRAAAPVDAAFAASLPDASRREALAAALPGLTDGARRTLIALDPSGWASTRAAAQKILGELERTELRDSSLATARAGLATKLSTTLDAASAELAAEIVSPLLVANSSYSETLTEKAAEAAAQAVPVVRETVIQGEVIVRNGTKITAADLEKITALGLNQSKADLAKLGGWLALAIVTVAALLSWVLRFRRELWHRTNALVLIGLVLVGATLAMKVTADRSIMPFFVPTATAGLLIASLLDSGLATFLMALVAIIAGAVNGGSVEITTYTFLGGVMGTLVIRRGERLQVFLQAGIVIAAFQAAVVATFGLLGEHDLTGVLQLLGASIAAATGAAILAVGSFTIIGNLFGLLTGFQLLELANPSQPLLRRLLTETPGTYHHSIMVGNLAERAADAIGADSLIARVASYYHDVGKLANPAGFIENQAGLENVHDSLDPVTSAQLLKQHIADGIDIAYEAKLPKQLIAFIPQHHGTAVMSYFYAKAQQQAAAPFGGIDTPDGVAAAAAVDTWKFRHSGPKPQSREAAILMLADGVEASVRSLASQDEAGIRAMVNRIISERLGDGQFDECDLTLRDIDRIREAFVGQLLGMYHRRVAYPQNKVVEIESRRATGTEE